MTGASNQGFPVTRLVEAFKFDPAIRRVVAFVRVPPHEVKRMAPRIWGRSSHEELSAMGHELSTVNGRTAMMYVGEVPWHGLGAQLAAPATARETIVAAGLDYEVELAPMTTIAGIPVPQKRAVVRSDTKDVLGVVGGGYVPVQNSQAFDFLDAVVADGGLRFHTAGAIYGGAKVWVQCALPSRSFEVVRGDRVDAYATFQNPHDGSGRAWCFPTTNRIVCGNTYRTASRDRSAGLGIRHTSAHDDQVLLASDDRRISTTTRPARAAPGTNTPQHPTITQDAPTPTPGPSRRAEASVSSTPGPSSAAQQTNEGS